MLRAFLLIALACTAAACGGSPTGPTGDGGRVPRLARTRFLAFGDSITAGEVTAPVSSATFHKQVLVPSAAYPVQLQSLLTARYASQASAIEVVNGGVSGETLVTGAVRFPQAITAREFDAVLIFEGVNGIGALGPEASTTLVREMVRLGKARNLRVFVASMLPTIANRQRSQDPAQLEAFNTRLRQMTVEESVVFVDLYTSLLPEVASVIGIDGLHPTEAGYRRVADLFFEAIKRELETP